jgi:polysaccharide pyruvyl transferase WcaK-like protein
MTQLKIGLLGPYGFGNLGDAAIQQAMIENIKKRYPDAEIHGLSLNPEDTEARHGIPSFPIVVKPMTGKNRLVKILKRIFIKPPLELILWAKSFAFLQDFDLLIVSGGGQLDDYWGGAFGHPYTLLKWAIIAKILQINFRVVSVGAGPIDSPLSRLFIKICLALASYRSYRDESSKKLISSIGFKRDDPVYPDLAHSLPVVSNEQFSEPKSFRFVVGINPIAYFDPRIWPDKDRNIYEGYLKKLVGFMRWLIENQYQIVLFPGEINQDRRVIKDIKALLTQQGVSIPNTQLIDRAILTVDELMEQISQIDLVLASRFHSVLLSYVAHKPVLAISYHPKIDVLMANLAQAEYCLDINTFEIDSLKEKFQSLESNLEHSRQQIIQKTREYRTALDAQYERIFSCL